MFKKNDKALLTIRIITMVVIAIFAVAFFVMGILFAVWIHGAFFLLTFVGWFGCWLMWVFVRLYLSYLVDVKLIRNKLYGESNVDLDVFLKTKEEKKQAVNATTALEHLYQLKISGLISDEEFDKCTDQLTKEN